MGKLIDLSAMRFGRLAVICKVQPPHGETRAFWLCRCDCGGESIVAGRYLRAGITRSCGCLVRETGAAMGANLSFIAIRAEKATRHGHKRRNATSPEYKTWLGMKRRCYDEACKDYKNWGGRGIVVCDRWNSSFEDFLADMGSRPSPAHQIDRIDPNGNYEPGNCRWVTPSTQGGENRRGIYPVTIDGISFASLSAACRHFGINHTTVYERIRNGYSIQEALAFKARGQKARRSRESYLPKSHPDRT